VIENLVGNAVKYSPGGGLIRLTLDIDENWLRLGVIDQGIGMTAAEKDNAFKRFYRADASNTAARGTGLGLSIAKYIVDAHGGTIKIFSQKGKGTRLEVCLPLLHD
ncbi:MAG: ATP-binding protein, partial [Geopsychrobacter sp.]|nr:ATP-binding protein [Geopsychrobacter sp.]